MFGQSKRVHKPKVIFDPSEESGQRTIKPKTTQKKTKEASSTEENDDSNKIAVPKVSKTLKISSKSELEQSVAKDGKRKAETKPSWEDEDHPQEKRLAAYRPRCSDECK